MPKRDTARSTEVIEAGRPLVASRAISVLSGALVVALAVATCGPSEKHSVVLQAAAASGESVPFDPPSKASGPQISEVRHSANSISFRLHFDEGTPTTGAENPLLFCVPRDRTLSVELVSYRVGGRAIIPRSADGETADAAPQRSPRTRSPLDPAKGLRIESLGVLRRWPIAALHIRRNFFAPRRIGGQDTVGEVEAELKLNWDKPFEPDPNPPFGGELDPGSSYGRLANAFVENPAGLRLYQMRRPPLRNGITARSTAPWTKRPRQSHWARLRIRDEGLYRLNLEDLIAAGFPPEAVTPQAVRIFSRSAPTPLARRGEGADQQIYFWNDRVRTPYSNERVFWVTLGDDLPDPAIPALEVDPAGAEIETHATTLRQARLSRDNEMRIEHGNFLSIKNITWVDAQLPPEGRFPFRLDFPGYVRLDRPLQARAKFYLESSGSGGITQRFEISLLHAAEAIAKTEVASNPRSPQHLNKLFELDPALIEDDKADLAFTVGPASEGSFAIGPTATKEAAGTRIWFDEIEIDYPSRPIAVEGKLTLIPSGVGRRTIVWTPVDPAFSPEADEVLSLLIGVDQKLLGTVDIVERDGRKGWLWRARPGRRVEIRSIQSIPDAPAVEPVSPSNLAASDQGADYLLIGHREFLDLAEPLLEMHRRRGLKTRTVDVQSVYDHFSHGELSPEAIRDFLAFTLTRWDRGAPSYVVLLGDATSDYKGLTRTDVKNWAPSYTYEFGGDRWASDNWMGIVAGEDDMAEFMIGRISVANREDAQTVIEKIVAYAESPKPGPWRATMGYVGDNGEFPAVLEELRTEHTPPAFEALRTYLDESMALEDNYYLEESLVAEGRLKVSPEATANIIRSFRRGMSYLTYYGHGSPNIWMDERVWFGGDSTNSDNLHLTGTGYATFVANMTCNSGAIDYPMPKWNISITEDMMRVRDGGAIALYVPSGPCVTSIHQKMSTQLRRTLFEDNFRRFGETIGLTQARYAAYGHPVELTYMYIFLGDPAIDLQLTSQIKTFTPRKRHFRPGSAIEMTLNDIHPPSGQFYAAVDMTDGREVARTEPADYDGGRISIQMDLPAQAPLGEAHLRLYAWDEDSGEDLAASAAISIESPRVKIENAVARWSDAGTQTIDVTVTNDGAIDCAGWEIEITRVTGEDESELVHREELNLAAGDSITLHARALTGPAATTDNIGSDEAQADSPSDSPPTLSAAEVYEVRIISPEMDRREDLDPDDVLRRLAAPPSKDWIGLVAGLSAVEPMNEGKMLRIEASVAGGCAGAQAQFLVGIDDSEGTFIASRSVELSDCAARVEFTFRGNEKDRALDGTLWLAKTNGLDRDPMERLSSLAVADLPKLQSRLRIVADSISISPESPFEGQTVLVSFDAENAGDRPSAPFTASLNDGDPRQGAKVLFAHIGATRQRADPLAPGRKRRITLRWDPIENAGDQEIWVRLDPGRNRGASTDADLALPYPFRVRTKYKLVNGRTYWDKRMGDDAEPQYWLIAEVMNRGETEVRNVIVTFYKSRERTEENKIGERLLTEIPPETNLRVQFPWEFDPESGEPPDESMPDPDHEMRLRGSLQRTIRLEPE